MTRYFAHIWRLRYFWLSLVRSDLRSRYRRSVLGVGWSLLQPIVMTIVLCTVFGRIFQAEVRSYGPFLLAGLVVWNFLATILSQGCQCFLAGESYLRQCPVPLAVFSLRTVLGAGIHLVIGLGVVIVLTWCLQGFGNLASLAGLLPALALLFALGWALATCMAVVNVLFHDTQHLTEVAIQILFYATPVMYSTDFLAERGLDWIARLNPFSVFLDVVREPVLQGRIPAMDTMALAAGIAAAAAALAMLVMWRLERRIIFYL